MTFKIDYPHTIDNNRSRTSWEDTENMKHKKMVQRGTNGTHSMALKNLYTWYKWYTQYSVERTCVRGTNGAHSIVLKELVYVVQMVHTVWC